MTFVVDQTKIQAHKLVLAMRSPVLAAQFHGEMKEKTMRCLRIHDMSASTFNAMLHFIYTDELPKPNKGASHLAMARDLLVAADLYDLERLRLMCENILSKSITVGNVMATLMLVHNRHSCRQLEACCVEFIASDPDLYNAVQATDEYKELEKECPSFMYETIKKVATLAVARKKSPSTSSTGHVTNSRESVSRYNPSAVMIGTHEFRIESLKAIRKTHSVGQYIQSGSFQVGGYEWAISVYPSGFEGDETEYIGLFLRRLTDNNDDDDADDDNDGGGGEDGDKNDDDADDYVKALMTFKLKDPTGNSPAHQKKITHVYDNGLGEGYGISDFITMESVNSHYLGHDGSLTVQCRVEVTTMSCTSSTVVAGTVIPVLQSNLALHLEQLLVSENGWDVKFLIEDSEIHAHGLVVATRSPALQEEVESATGMDHVKIDAMRATVFKAILYFIYTDELPRVDDHVPVVGGDSTMIAGEMLAAASRFRLERMKRLCENLLAENITPKNALATLRIAGRHGCTELEGHCVEYMSLPHVAKDVMKSLKSFL